MVSVSPLEAVKYAFINRIIKGFAPGEPGKDGYLLYLKFDSFR